MSRHAQSVLSLSSGILFSVVCFSALILRCESAASEDRFRFSAVIESEDGQILVASANAVSNDRIPVVTGNSVIAIRDNRKKEIKEMVLNVPTVCFQLALNPSRNFLAHDDWNVSYRFYLWDLEKGTLISKIDAGAMLKELAFSPDGKFLALALADMRDRPKTGVWLYNLKSGEFLSVAPNERGARTVAFSPDGKTLAAGFEGGVNTFDLETKMLKHTFKHSKSVSVAFSADQRFLASAGYDSTSGPRNSSIRVWELETRKEHATFDDGHPEIVKKITFSPNSKQLASACYDKTVKIWNLESKMLTTKFVHETEALNCAFSKDGNHVLAPDGNVLRRWSIELGTSEEIKLKIP